MSSSQWPALPASRFGLSRLLAGLLVLVVLTPEARSADEVVIGQTLPLTGPTGSLGQAIRAGTAVCVNLINAQGGIAGRQLRLAVLDDAGDSGRALQNARQLVEHDHVALLMGPIGVSSTAAVQSYAAQVPIAVLGAQEGTPALRGSTYPTSFFIRANHSAEAERLAVHLSALGISRIAVIAEASDLGHSVMTSFDEALAVRGTRLQSLALVKHDGTDARSAVERVLLGTPPQAIVLATSGAASVRTIRELARVAPDNPMHSSIYAFSFAVSQEDLLSLGHDAASVVMTQVMPSPFDDHLELVKIYSEALRSAGQSQRSYPGMEACLAPLVLRRALKPMSGREVTAGTVVRALRAAGLVTVGGLDIDLNGATRDGAGFVDIVLVGADGHFTH